MRWFCFCLLVQHRYDWKSPSGSTTTFPSFWLSHLCFFSPVFVNYSQLALEFPDVGKISWNQVFSNGLSVCFGLAFACWPLWNVLHPAASLLWLGSDELNPPLVSSKKQNAAKPRQIGGPGKTVSALFKQSSPSVVRTSCESGLVLLQGQSEVKTKGFCPSVEPEKATCLT